ncbi:MAG: hypothetical protein WC509_02040 [Candidatus Izemoplasmatales bacterium]
MEYHHSESLIRYFEQEITETSAKEIEAILREVVAIKSKELAKIELEVKQQVALSQGVRLKEIRDAQRAEINRLIADRNQKLSARRNEIAQSIFAAVEAKLVAYVGSPAYRTHMAEKAETVAKHIGDEGLVFHLAPADAVGQAAIEGVIPAAKHEFDATIRLGGFRAVNPRTGLEIDETFDNRLARNREWFYAHSQLFVRN